MIGWMRHIPRWAVILVCVIAALLLFVGASAHVADLLSHGLHPYGWAPSWLNLYWWSPALFDTLAVVFLIRGKRRGTDLACAHHGDLAANWYAVYGIQHSSFAAQPGLQRMTVFAALVLGTAPFIRRHLTTGPAASGACDRKAPGCPRSSLRGHFGLGSPQALWA
ncbi:hypothetical protein AB0B30_19005 [Streptomyces narbonensis]|uniref:DUF2637 domain-containing protein n=1 Tax=Streptomyces narbonensis TaxID=67333 RepID=A0ABV3C7B2_9ACTN